MKNVVIFGDTMFAEELSTLIHFGGGNVVAFTLNEKYIKNNSLCGLPIYPFEILERYIDMDNTGILLALGYNKMNKIREEKYHECKEKGYTIHSYISCNANVYTKDIGEGCIIMPGAYIGPFSTLGIGNVIRSGCVLSHHETIGNFNWIADGSIYGGHVQQGNNCFTGLGTTVRNGISIANSTFIGAHSYQNKNTVHNGVYWGNPTKYNNQYTSSEIISKV